jgi:hypothetical protein
MSKLRGQFLLLKNPPQTEGQEAYAKRLGFRKRRSGLWVKPDVAHASPPLEALQKHGPGHTCQACRGFFRSKTQRDQYCPSCRGIIDGCVQELTLILQSAAKGTANQSRSAIATVQKALACTFPTGPITRCGWRANQGRSEPQNIVMVIEYLRRWVEKAHCHHMRHVFWNRFPYSKKFFPFVESQEEKEKQYRDYYDSKWNRKLDRILGVPAIEIKYPEEE